MKKKLPQSTRTKNYREYDYIIGIDPGVKTGVAIWDVKNRRLAVVDSFLIHKAMELVKGYASSENVLVRVEDARLRKWFGDRADFNHQGAGSIKRDCGIWHDCLHDTGIEYEMVKPIIGCTKLTTPQFKALTGWQPRTNEHARDAAMLVYGL